MRVRYVRNSDVDRVFIARPRGHRHYRLFIILGDEVLVFSEATLANIARAYVTLVTRPDAECVELVRREGEWVKREFARSQLLEREADCRKLEQEAAHLLSEES